MAGRVLHLALDLLDRQLRDREGRLCGNVDDLELEWADDGTLHVVAILSGAGALAYRLGARRAGRRLRIMDQRLHDADRSRIPIELATGIGPAIDVAVDANDVAATSLEQWLATHVLARIPGAERRAGQ